MTRTEPASSPSPGDRVVVRFRKGTGAPGDWRRDPSATASDVTGVLVSSDAAGLVVARDGSEVRVPRELVMSVRTLSDRPVRNSEIRSLEIAAARGWPGTDFTIVRGWIARSGGGFSRRANSATPVEPGATLDTETITELTRYFGEHGLPTRCAVVERLIPSSHIESDRFEIQAIAMVRSTDGLATPGDTDIVAHDVPTDEWVRSYLGSSDRVGSADVATAVVSAALDGVVVFVSVSDADRIVAIGRGTVTSDEPFGAVDTGRSWVGISCLWTAPHARGTGIGTAVVAELLQWGGRHGADNAYLQVESTNDAAIRLYRRLGFTRHHTYGYITL